MSLQRQHFLLSYLIKDPECWFGRGLNQQPPAKQTGGYPIELTGRRLLLTTKWHNIQPGLASHSRCYK